MKMTLEFARILAVEACKKDPDVSEKETKEIEDLIQKVHMTLSSLSLFHQLDEDYKISALLNGDN